MRRLRARRHVATCAPRAGRTVANCKDAIVARCLQCRPYHKLIDAVGFEAGDILQEIRRLDSCSPDDQFGGNRPAVRQIHTIGADLGDLGSDQHTNPQPGEQLLRLLRNPFRQRRKHPLGGLNQRNPDVLLRVDLIEAVRHDFTCCSVEFGRKLDAGCTGADDCDL